MTDPTPEQRAGRLLADMRNARRHAEPRADDAACIRLIAAEVRAAEEAARAQPPPAPEEVAAEVRAVLTQITTTIDARLPGRGSAPGKRLVFPSAEEWQAQVEAGRQGIQDLAAVRRLLWLLGLPPGERRFVTALADDAADFAGLAVFADWLEQGMRDDDAGRVRKLTPQTGDVLVLRIPDRTPGQHIAAREFLQNIRDGLKARGIDVVGLALAPGWDLEALRPEALAGTGLCRAQDALYLHRPGQPLSAAARLAVEGGYAGLAVNGVALLRQEGETAATLLMRCFMEADRGRREDIPMRRNAAGFWRRAEPGEQPEAWLAGGQQL